MIDTTESPRFSTPEFPDLTLFELVARVQDADKNRAALDDAQQRLLKARIQRDSQIPGLEREVKLMRERLAEIEVLA